MLRILCLKNWVTYLFSGIKLHSAYTYTINAISFDYLWYGAIYNRQYYNIEKLYVYASERSERAQKTFAFSHSKTAISFNILLVQILCRYKRHACRLTCTDKFPNVPTKLRRAGIMGGGGGLLPPAPPPPPGYAIYPCHHQATQMKIISQKESHNIKHRHFPTLFLWKLFRFSILCTVRPNKKETRFISEISSLPRKIETNCMLHYQEHFLFFHLIPNT